MAAKAKTKTTPKPDQDRVGTEEGTTDCPLQPITTQSRDQLTPAVGVAPDTDDATTFQQPPQQSPPSADQAQCEIKRL